MAQFEAKLLSPTDINGGEQYKNGDIVDANAINAPIEAALLIQSLATSDIDVSNAGDPNGVASVSIVRDGNAFKFKFSHIKGDKPVNGLDYNTEADKQEMVSLVLAALPTYQGEVQEI